MERNELDWKAQLSYGTKLPAAAYIIIGATITTASMVINYMSSSYRFTIFAVLGLAMFIYGTVKAISHEPRPKPHQRAPGNHKHNVGVHHGVHAAAHHAKRVVSGQRASQYHFCPYCAARIPPHASFCPGCGQKMPG